MPLPFGVKLGGESEKNMKNYIKNGDFYFTEDTDINFMNFINKAYKQHARVVIEYHEGFENFSRYHGGNGLKHSMYIGKSCGQIKIPLEICRKDSMGGQALLTNKKAIKKYYTK